MAKSITIYRFDDAPQELRDLSENGGDEDWVVVVPHELDGGFWGCVERMSIRDYEEYNDAVPDHVIYITNHA